MNLDSGRMAFRVNSRMVPVPANFSSQYRRRGLSLTCPSCTMQSPARSNTRDSCDMTATPNPPPPILSQSHLLTNCVAVSDLRETCNPDDEESVALFFRRVVARQMEIDEADKQD